MAGLRGGGGWAAQGRAAQGKRRRVCNRRVHEQRACHSSAHPVPPLSAEDKGIATRHVACEALGGNAAELLSKCRAKAMGTCAESR